MKCWPWKHEWKIYDIYQDAFNSQLVILCKCEKCRKLKTERIDICYKLKIKSDE